MRLFIILIDANNINDDIHDHDDIHDDDDIHDHPISIFQHEKYV